MPDFLQPLESNGLQRLVLAAVTTIGKSSLRRSTGPNIMDVCVPFDIPGRVLGKSVKRTFRPSIREHTYVLVPSVD